MFTFCSKLPHPLRYSVVFVLFISASSFVVWYFAALLSIYLSTYLSIYSSICLFICPSVCLSLYLCFYSPFIDLVRSLSSSIVYTVGRTLWKADKPVTTPQLTHRATQTQNKRIQTCMPWMGFEPTIPALERAKTVHALYCAATVIGSNVNSYLFIYPICLSIYLWLYSPF
jgi:hypothetical protein